MCSNVESFSSMLRYPPETVKRLFKKEDCTSNLGARALCVAQSITSIVAIPLIGFLRN